MTEPKGSSRTLWVACDRINITGNDVTVWLHSPVRLKGRQVLWCSVDMEDSMLNMPAADFLKLFGFRPRAGTCVEVLQLLAVEKGAIYFYVDRTKKIDNIVTLR